MPAGSDLRAHSPLERRLLGLAETAAAALAMRIVRVRVQGAQRQRVQIMAERLADGGMDVEDCARLSRDLSAVFDVDDPIRGEYTLEVSSPGIDRPLTALADFTRWAGHEAKIETKILIDGRKRYSGVLTEPRGDEIGLIGADGAAYFLPFEALHDARLTLSERLIAEDLKRAAADQPEETPASPAPASRTPKPHPRKSRPA